MDIAVEGGGAVAGGQERLESLVRCNPSDQYAGDFGNRLYIFCESETGGGNGASGAKAHSVFIGSCACFENSYSNPVEFKRDASFLL